MSSCISLENDQPEKESQFRNLKWSLQALAVPPSEQLALFPDYAAKVDDLAVDFDKWASVIRTNYETDLTSTQTESLTAIERRLSLISRLGTEYDPDIWTEAALGKDEYWAAIRTLAATALEAFGWSVESPPGS
ncbi:MAG: hypothetical protein H0W08_19160 [Acidobacteria bacterium]|nr:hypothetical protein [Acidobacteriota bacterium]